MIENYLLLTAGVIAAALIVSYRRTGDPLSPLVTFTPMLLYVYAYHPFVIQWGEVSASTSAVWNPSSDENPLLRYFPRSEEIEYILLVNLISVSAFCLGASHFRRSRVDDQRFWILEETSSLRVRQRFLQLALVLGTIAGAAFWGLVYRSGGPLRMFQQAKPFFASASGYIGELPMLTYPALLLLAAAYQGRTLTVGRWVVLLYVASPQIAWAIIGKRRGTIFLIAAMLSACWYLIKDRKPNWKVMIGGVGMLGLLLLFIVAHRVEAPQETLGLHATLTGTHRLTEGDEFVAAGATILASERYSHHFWGVRALSILVVRPIPSGLWPTKWHDVGLGWMETQPGLYGLTTSQWNQALGFQPAVGTAGGFVADAYLEWAWGGVLACYGLGFGFSWLWKRWVTRGGMWTALYIEAMILSVYLPSQSLGAWTYRFALLSVPTVMVFHLLMPRSSLTRSSPPQTPILLRTF